MLSVIVSHFIALSVGGAGGAYLYYRYGSKLAADAAKVKSVL